MFSKTRYKYTSNLSPPDMQLSNVSPQQNCKEVKIYSRKFRELWHYMSQTQKNSLGQNLDILASNNLNHYSRWSLWLKLNQNSCSFSWCCEISPDFCLSHHNFFQIFKKRSREKLFKSIIFRTRTSSCWQRSTSQWVAVKVN